MPRAMEAARTYTHDDLLAMPDDGKRYEIIDGELFEMTGPFRPHQWAVGRLYLRLGNFLEANPLGTLWLAPFDVILSPTNVVEPDLLFVSAERDHIIPDWVRGVPDLVVEVVSPSNRRHDEVRKRTLYERFAVGEYWLIDPEVEEVKVYRLAEGKYGRPTLLEAGRDDVLSSPLFPGWEMPAASTLTSRWPIRSARLAARGAFRHSMLEQ